MSQQQTARQALQSKQHISYCGNAPLPPPPPVNIPLWSFWLAISAAPGWVSRKKVPLAVLLKLTWRSHTRRWSFQIHHCGEINLSGGGVSPVHGPVKYGNNKKTSARNRPVGFVRSGLQLIHHHHQAYREGKEHPTPSGGVKTWGLPPSALARVAWLTQNRTPLKHTTPWRSRQRRSVAAEPPCSPGQSRSARWHRRRL